MGRRYPRPLPAPPDVFGTLVPVVALLASRTEPMALKRHDPMMERLEIAYREIATAEDPNVQAWRDLTDVVNFLKSLVELGLAVDEGAWIEDARDALHEAAIAFEQLGKIRLRGLSLSNLRATVDQYAELTRQMPEYDFWRAVAHTKKRVDGLRRGARRAGDIVVGL